MLGSIASAIGSLFSAPAPPPPPAPRPIDVLSALPEHLEKKGEQEKVDYVFKRFCNFGWKYDLSLDFGSTIIGSLPAYYPEDISANCKGLARALGEVLQRLGIAVTLEAVREPVEGRRFVVRLTHFIDPQVQGNIKDQYGRVLRGCYLFREHWALWVPRARKYYDPMAKATYTDLKPFIAWELVTLDGSEDEYISIDGRYLFHATEDDAGGRFVYYQMEEIGRKELKTYGKVLKSKGFHPKKR